MGGVPFGWSLIGGSGVQHCERHVYSATVHNNHTHYTLWCTVKHSYSPHTVVNCETQLCSAIITYTTHCSALWNTAMFRNNHIHYTLLCVVKHSYVPQWSHTLHTVVRCETQLRSAMITYTTHCSALWNTIITYTTHCCALWNTAMFRNDHIHYTLLCVVKHSYGPQWSHTLHTVVRCETQLRSAMITYTTHCCALWNTATFHNNHIHTLHTVVRGETQLRSTIITHTHYTL